MKHIFYRITFFIVLCILAGIWLVTETYASPFCMSYDDEADDSDSGDSYETTLLHNYVVVLDPGHDSYHGGAFANGLNEEQLNFQIANYCKEELERNPQIKVYLTHDTMTCPFPYEDPKLCNKARCDFAASVHADLFVSIHINNIYAKYVRGLEIYYQTKNYRSVHYNRGQKLAMYLQDELLALGMINRGIFTKNSTENKYNDENFYPDGSRADYYNVLRNCKYNDITAVIIEHGYLSNRNDVNTFLNTDSKLQRLAVADSIGILRYLSEIDKNASAADLLMMNNNRKDALSSFETSQLHSIPYMLHYFK